MKIYPYEKGGERRKRFSYAAGLDGGGGGKWLAMPQVLEVLATLNGGGAGGGEAKVSTLYTKKKKEGGGVA